MSQLSPRRLIALAVLLLGVASAAVAVLPASTAVLETLSKDMRSARSQPPGSRPAPADVDLTTLVGASRSDVRRILAMPSFCEPQDRRDCGHSQTWVYVWGPAPETTLEPSGSIERKTGGPWLLKIEFATDAVSKAYWQGQR